MTLPVIDPARDEIAEPPAAVRRPPSLAVPLRLAPGVAVLAVLAACLLVFDVSVRDVAAFGLYLGLAVVLPGTLLWRAFGPALRWRVEEWAAGAGIGYALEVLARIAASALGVPALGLAVPALVVVVLVAAPRLRRRLRSPARPIPAAMAWAYAAIITLLVCWFAYSYFRSQPLVWSGRSYPSYDLVFTLSFTADVAHRWPPEFPYVLGQPLLYHWFFATHLATAATATGIELPVLLFRVALLPMLPLLVVATGALAVRLSGRPWTGPLAGLFGWIVNEPPLTDLRATVEQVRLAGFGNLLGPILWMSPTLTYSAVLLAPAALLLVDVVRRQARWGHWALLAVVLVAVSGAKGSVLPVLIGGTGAVVALHLAVRQRLHRPALGALVLAAVAYVVSYQVVYGGESYGTRWDVFGVASQTAMSGAFTGHWAGNPGVVRSAAITLLMLACFLAPWLGTLALLRRGTRTDPAAWLLAGIAVVGVLTAVVLFHSGQSQLYFLRHAVPLLAAGGAWGIATLVPAGERRAKAALAVAFAVGATVCATVAAVAGLRLRPRLPGFTIATMVAPYAATAAVLLALAAAFWLVRRRWPRALPAVGVVAVVAALVGGAGAVRLVGQTAYGAHLIGSGAPLNPRAGVPPGPEQTAAAWVRDHTDPDDVLVTNVHCANGVPWSEDVEFCDALAFWVSAYTERRTLVSGWGYTAVNARMGMERGTRRYPNDLPFWDLDLLRRNDRFLRAPTAAEASALGKEYGVRWVFVDDNYGETSPELGTVLRTRFRSGPITVYEIVR